MVIPWLCYLNFILVYICEAKVVRERIVTLEAPTVPPITCWTCPNRTNNEACNNWAPDKYCPTNHTVCRTVHRLHQATGRSVFVNKQCVPAAECTSDMIGCHETDMTGVQDCVSCCDFAYCNEPVPTNRTTALLYSSLSTAHRTSFTAVSLVLYITCVLCGLDILTHTAPLPH